MRARNAYTRKRLESIDLKPKLVRNANFTDFIDLSACLKYIAMELQAGHISSLAAKTLTGIISEARQTLRDYLTYIGEYREKKQVDVTIRDERIQQFAEMPDEQRKVTLEDYRKVENRLIQRMKEAGLLIARDN